MDMTVHTTYKNDLGGLVLARGEGESQPPCHNVMTASGSRDVQYLTVEYSTAPTSHNRSQPLNTCVLYQQMIFLFLFSTRVNCKRIKTSDEGRVSNMWRLSYWGRGRGSGSGSGSGRLKG